MDSGIVDDRFSLASSGLVIVEGSVDKDAWGDISQEAFSDKFPMNESDNVFSKGRSSRCEGGYGEAE